MRVLLPAIINRANRLLVFFVLTTASCSLGGDSDISRGLALHKKGDTSRALKLMGKGLIATSALEKFSSPYPEPAGEALVTRGENSFSLVYPRTITIKDPDDIESFAYSTARESFAVSKGPRVIIRDSRGKVRGEVTLSAALGTRIRALAWAGNAIICYAGGRLYRCDADAGLLPDLIVNQTFTPPQGNSYYSATISATPELILLVTGIGGQYTMNGIDVKGRKVLFKNTNLSSPKILVRDGTVLYITGSAGQWKLISLTLDGRTRKEMGVFPSLVDIGLFRQGVLYENANGFHVFEFNKGHIRLPFRYILLGSCGTHALIGYDGKMHLADTEVFFKQVLRMKEELPDLFRERD